jgi:DNA-binding response OmpR family regulator
MQETRGRILIAEDDELSAELLAALLTDEGFQPLVEEDVPGALAVFEREHPIAVFIDWVIPGGSGVELCRRIRSNDAVVPIFFVTARADEASASRGLDAGADDFITKPVRPRELVARLEAHLRKLSARPATAALAPTALEDHPSPSSTANVQRFGDVEVDLEARRVLVGGRQVMLGALEFRLLEYLVRNAGIALSRDQILEEVHGYEGIPTERVDLLVRRLRSKLGWDQWITAVPGYGYRLERSLG